MYTYLATIYNVVDGDTVDAHLDLGLKIFSKQRLRLLGVDTPERGQEGYSEAKEFVAEMILNKTLMIKTYKVSKFGYYLAEIFLDKDMKTSINKEIIRIGLGVEYHGEKKE